MKLSPRQFTELSQISQSTAEATGILLAAFASEDEGTFLAEALPFITLACGADVVVLAASEGGKWNELFHDGELAGLPIDVLGEALDQGELTLLSPWMAVPLRSFRESPDGVSPMVLAMRPTEVLDDARQSQRFSQTASILALSLSTIHQLQSQDYRIKQLQLLLELSGEWSRTQELEPLLVQLAEAATQLLQADRATIFLWDQEHHCVVGRPALGIEGGQLRIADDVGLVGRVLQTQEPHRVDLGAGQQWIDHVVDKQTGYETHTLLCVPLMDDRGRTLGAFEVINKHKGNFSLSDERTLAELATHAGIALRNTQQRQELLSAHRQMTEQAASGARLIGNCPAIEALRQTVDRVATTDLAVLILGENGTGKEVVSQAIHYHGSRRDQPFVAVNCAAIAESLLESELFGHEKGAFTDAHEARPGKFELASGGTLFLDEIGDLSLAGQAKLLRVLEEKVVVRVGGSTPIFTNSRVVAATNQDLADLVREKKFREDLYFRLNVVTITLPPLRERGEDVLLLAEHFLTQFSRQAGRVPAEFTDATRKRLTEHAWPGNVRELRNLMERLAYLHSKEQIEAEDLAFTISPRDSKGADKDGEREGFMEASFSEELPLSAATEEFQAEYIRRTVAACQGNMTAAAQRLGLHRSNMYRKLRQLGLSGEF